MGNPSQSGYGISQVAKASRIAAPILPYLPRMPRDYRPKIGLIGAGGITEYHLRNYKLLGLDIVAICNPSRERAEKRRVEFYPEAAVYSDHREVLARDDIDVVDIATHPAPRVQIIEDALRAKKHVLSQKPFALHLDTVTRLSDLADQQGCRLAVNQNARWAPHFSYLNQAIRSGLIGDVATIDFNVQFDHSWTLHTPFNEMHHLILFDFAVHWFDIATVFMEGRAARSVSANVNRSAEQTIKPPSLAQIIVDYGDAQVRMSFNALVKHGQEDRTTICGSLGTLRSFGPSLTEQTVTLHTVAGEASPQLDGNWFVNGFQGSMAELLCAIDENREPSNSARNNLRTLELCFAAIASANDGQPKIPGSVRSINSV
ncbi:MAG: Gfo/Idh/MocA family oxidoreductase [Luteolibacter sp.]